VSGFILIMSPSGLGKSVESVDTLSSWHDSSWAKPSASFFLVVAYQKRYSECCST
jgi:hypothetical protein